VRVTPVDSLTNRAYRVATPGGSYVLRLAGTTAQVDRAAEVRHQRLAAAAGLAPDVVFADPADGTLLTVHAAGARPLAPADLARSGPRTRVARALRALHGSGAPFVGAVSLARTLSDYRAQVAALCPGLPADTETAIASVAAAAERLATMDDVTVPSHCDPSPPNLLDTGRRVLLIDWEYAGVADPLWDVATVAVEAALDSEGAWALLVAYLGRDPTYPESGRLFLHMAGLDVLGGLWGLVQHVSGNAAADFEAYAARRLARGAAWARSGALDAACDAVAGRAPRSGG
jgi:thiamine kinase-like enzyme